MSSPTKEYRTALKYLLHYSKRNPKHGVLFTKEVSLTQTRHETWTIANRLQVILSTNKISCVALSTAKTEHVAMSSTAQELVWLRQLYGLLITNGHVRCLFTKFEEPLLSLEYYRRFIDDIFFIWNGNLLELNSFLDRLKKVAPTIKLTWNICQENPGYGYF